MPSPRPACHQRPWVQQLTGQRHPPAGSQPSGRKLQIRSDHRRLPACFAQYAGLGHPGSATGHRVRPGLRRARCPECRSRSPTTAATRPVRGSLDAARGGDLMSTADRPIRQPPIAFSGSATESGRCRVPPHCRRAGRRRRPGSGSPGSPSEPVHRTRPRSAATRIR